jgi:hypothetical protein
MARATAQAEDEKDFTKYADKAPTSLQQRFGAWLVEKVGLTFGTKKEEAAFMEGVRLGTALRIPFQRSDENQTERAQAAATRAEAPKPAKKVAAAEEPKPAKRGKKAQAEPEAAAAAPAKAAKPRKATRAGVAAPF